MFSNKLKELREEKGLTQAQLAEVFQVSKSAIANYESGFRLPKDNLMWKKIANYFNVSVDYLMDINNAPNNTTKSNFFSYSGSSNPKKAALINLINKSNITDEQIDLLTNMIESWK